MLSVARYDVQNQRVVLNLGAGAPYAAGTRVMLTLGFNGTLGNDMTGLYRSSYKDDTGKTVNMVATQFEATYARRAWPCFDEPAYKAVFNVSVDNVPAGYTALGNMPVASEATNADGTRRVTFQSLPRLSTYLVAVAVAPMVGVSGLTSNGLNVTAWAVNRANNSAKLTFARDVALKVIPYYESIFGLPFPLPKMDMIAIPDFAAGAMENQGLITYRETALLALPNASTQSELQRVSIVVAHELAHQWFGDLVTMDWWSALFLNEGFASLVEYIGCDVATPQFEAFRQFYSSDVITAMNAVQWGASRALVTTVATSAEIESQFDGVAYSMGASLLQSTAGFMESVRPGSFFAGVGAYLAAHEGGNASPEALWAALGASGGLPDLPAYLTGYTSQVGFPRVTLSWADPASETSGAGSLVVTQVRHFTSTLSRAAAPPSQQGYTWWVPLTLLSGSGGPNPVTAAAAAALTSGGFTTQRWGVTIGNGGSPYNVSAHGWVKANANASGFFRVNYPLNVWRSLASGAAAQVAGSAPAGATPLSNLDRAQIIEDLFAFAEGGTDLAAQPVDMPFALDQVNAILSAGEASYEAWMPAMAHLSSLRGLLFSDDGTIGAYGACLANAESFIRRLLTPLIASLGGVVFNPSDAPLTVNLRSSALSSGSNVNVSVVVANASSLYAAWAADVTSGGPGSVVPADLLPLVLANAVRWQVAYGGKPAFQLLLELTAGTDDSGAKRRYLNAMSATRDAGQIANLLSASLDSAVVRSQDTVSVIGGVAANPLGRAQAWAFTKANWDVLMARYGSGGFALSDLVTSTARYFASAASYADVRGWYLSHPMSGAQLEWQQATESIATRAAWREAQLDATCTKLAALA